VNELLKFISNPTILFTLNCCVGPIILFGTGLTVGMLAGRGYTVRLDRRR
jgi:hypothetical protein